MYVYCVSTEYPYLLVELTNVRNVQEVLSNSYSILTV